jgi:2-hydroxychromene-2-carboxylate isomerase
MGDLIFLAERRSRQRTVPPHARRTGVEFYFDLSSPSTYLAAERVDRLFRGVRWRPTLGGGLAGADIVGDPWGREARRATERRAVELGMPLVWPERWPASGRTAMRVATLAVDRGRAAPFVLAASRLAFCGGYDLDDPEVLAEAAAAAGLGLRDSLAAAGDADRDVLLEQATFELLSLGGEALPAFVVGPTLYCGEPQLAAAAAAAAARRPRRSHRRRRAS